MKEELLKILKGCEYKKVGGFISDANYTDLIERLEEYILKEKEVSWREGYGDGSNGVPW